MAIGIAARRRSGLMHGPGKWRAPRHGRMPPGERSAVYVILGSLWLSGCIWLYLDKFLAKRGPFGITPHPLEAPLLLLHGVVAVASMYLFGWIAARHVARWWPRGSRRLSGAAFAALLAALSVSGFSLFFLVDDAAMRAAALIHDVVGLAVTLFAVQHWFFFREARRPGD